MRTATISGVIWLVVAASSGAASAQSEFRTQALYEMCKADMENLSTPQDYGEKPINQGFCLGYLSGIATMQVLIGEELKDRTKLTGAGRDVLRVMAACNARFTAASLRQLFLNWAEANPKLWHLPAGAGAFTAFSRAWPCS